MRITITGSLGNVSKPLAQELIAKGHNLTIISSKTDKKDEIEAIGARAAIGSVDDSAFLTAAFSGAEAIYAMTPPNLRTADPIGYYKNVANAYATAVQKSQVKHLVYLSSYGADLEKGSGIILGSHAGEGILSKLKDVTVTILRPGYFYYNLYNFMGMLKAEGVLGANYGGEDKLIMVSPLDIAAAAAEELTAANAQPKVLYIASEERTCKEVAKMIGEAIGKPALQWLTFTDEQVKKSMLEHGMSTPIADLLVELGAAIHNGLLQGDYDKHKPVLGKTKLDMFLREFAAAYV